MWQVLQKRIGQNSLAERTGFNLAGIAEQYIEDQATSILSHRSTAALWLLLAKKAGD
jgi:hypothetical protein